MKPDFDKMDKAELKAYVLAHRNDNEAFSKLINIWEAENQNSTWFPYPKTPEDIAMMREIIKERVRQIEEKS